MRAIELAALADLGPGSPPGDPRVPVDLLDSLAAGLARRFRFSCRVQTKPLDVSFAFDPARRQYHSTAILARMQEQRSGDWRLLGITGHDLYVPVLTFVFGEAQLEGRCAVVSLHRLREDYYGLPPDGKLLQERLLKAATHELGHTFGLHHCADWNCVMASTHAVERLDVKGAEFCGACRGFLGQAA
jgi:archaemetzincin